MIGDGKLDETVMEQIVALRTQKKPVSRKKVMQLAKSAFCNLQAEGLLGSEATFSASLGWLEKFMLRNGLSLHRKTSIAQKLPAQLIPKLIEYICYVQSLQSRKKYSPSGIMACDETACWLEPVPTTTTASTGSREVTIRNAGRQKVHFTVMLAAKASGQKLRPFLVINRVRPLPNLEKSFPKLLIGYNRKNGWFNQELTIEFLEKVIGAFSFQCRLLVWDAFSCHLSAQTKARARQLGLDLAFVPGGCTGLVQAPDVSWNKPFKQKLCEWLNG